MSSDTAVEVGAADRSTTRSTEPRADTIGPGDFCVRVRRRGHADGHEPGIAGIAGLVRFTRPSHDVPIVMSTMPAGSAKTTILLVDDEPFVLEGLRRQLARQFDVLTAAVGRDALALLAEHVEVAVILCDLRMPGMSGVEVLAAARDSSPDTVRLLLTGNADLDAALAAVNEGEVFRFLTKPCPPQVLLSSLEAAVRQYHLVTAERVLLEQTLRGSIQALIDTLSIANPVAFGRASRIKERAAALAGAAGIADLWRVEVAAMLSQIGMIALPPSTVDKLAAGDPLTDSEQASVERLPAVVDQLLGQIPRIDEIRAMIAFAGRPFEGHSRHEGNPSFRAGSVLRIVLEYDSLESRGIAVGEALERMRAAVGSFDPSLLDVLARVLEVSGPQGLIRTMPLHHVNAGMTFVDEVRNRSGILLIPKGFRANVALLERIRNIPADAVAGDVRVRLEPPSD